MCKKIEKFQGYLCSDKITHYPNLKKVATHINWKGIYPAATTKFTDDDQLDFEAIEKNFNVQVEAGVSGIILGGTLGEASTLSVSEKEDLVKFTVGNYSSKVPILLNIAEQTTKGAIGVAKRAEDLGIDGLMLLPPMRYSPDPLETTIYLKNVAKSTRLPIIIYNNPIDYNTEVTIDMFRKILELENIQAVKESTRDITNVTRLKNTFGDRLKILTGVDTLGMESLLMGADGWVAGLVCAFPRETVAIYKLIKAGKNDEALKIYRWFIPLLELDVSTKLVQNIKLAEVATGIGTENVRAPRLKLYGKERKKIQKIIDIAIATRPTLPDYLNILPII
jgi:1-pyrroline-4-hydroxy-2-carboxylate deaminase